MTLPWGERVEESIRRIPPKSWEAFYVKEHPNIWAGIKTVESLIPFGKMLGLTPSGREEWKMQSGGEKVLGTSLDVLAVTGVGILGKGWKSLSQIPRLGIKGAKGLKKAPPLELMDNVIASLEKKVGPFVKRTPEGILGRKYGIPEDEINAWKAGAGNRLLWRSAKRSEELEKILDKEAWKKGEFKFTTEVAKELSRASEPYEKQFNRWAKGKYNQAVSSVMGEEFLGKSFEGKSFKLAATKLYGEQAKDWTLESATPEIFARIANDLLDNRGMFQGIATINYGKIWPSYLKPVRYLFGQGERMFRTFTRAYKPLSEAYFDTNGYAMSQLGTFGSILADKGLGKIVTKKTGEKIFRLTKKFRDDYEQAGPALVKIGEAAYKGADIETLDRMFLGENPVVRNFIRAWFEFSDQLYLDHMQMKIPQLFRSAGLKGAGETELERMLGGVVNDLRLKFSPARDARLIGEGSGDLFKPGKRELIHQALNQFKEKASTLSSRGYLDADKVGELVDVLTPGRKGWPDYLENYVTRIRNNRLVSNRTIASTLFPKGSRLHAFYTKGRLDPVGKELATNLGDIVEARVRAQSKELMFYPEVERVLGYASQLPEQYRTLTGHYIFRLLGFPSPVDTKIANWLAKTAGGVERWLGKGSGVWDERRVQNLAYNINNIVYMGGLGFKPFSALRNLFQPIMLVPADLGGAKDIGWFIKGVQRATSRELRDYVRNDLKMIAEYAPEMHSRAQAIAGGKRIVLGGKKIDLPSMQEVRDMGMWMFKMSDRWNRYVSAGAALSKWEHFAKKYYDPVRQTMRKNFEKKMNISGRNDWIRDDIRGLLKGGGEDNIRRAKDLFVSDVIGDTQYLYGITDAPLISHTLGAPGKMAMIFQSWWMNYGTLLEKWMLTGEAPTKVSRLFNYIFASAASYMLMEQVWGKGTAKRTIGLGPLPSEVNEFLIPPTFDPIYHGVNAIVNAPTDLEATRRHGRELLQSGMIMLPGGLQLKQTIKGAAEEGFPGFLASVVRYSPPED